MTQEQALERLKEMRPAEADRLFVTRERHVGARYGSANCYKAWLITGGHKLDILATSDNSWEDVLHQLDPASDIDEPWEDDVLA